MLSRGSQVSEVTSLVATNATVLWPLPKFLNWPLFFVVSSDGWIWTRVLWCQKQLYYRLCLFYCPKFLKFFISGLSRWQYIFLFSLKNASTLLATGCAPNALQRTAAPSVSPECSGGFSTTSAEKTKLVCF